ncbi:dextranase [Paenibacillus sp. yr247]|uniref:glycoside hydrolase family 66 protein n=1 Tax=Paenibacillus sp. yr247 TaxID=1761880 RepID=UPI00088ECF81|nr:glycoside hydrolase family 66 protein [Paenibacillus sp. yr247]SDN52247.1 dextranase [Paenibacillus sp. yr247]
MMLKSRLQKTSLLFLSFVICLLVFHPTTSKAAATGIIKRVYTDKAKYNPSSAATISVEMTNDSGAAFNGNVTLTISHLETQTYLTSQAVVLATGASTTVTFPWTTPATDYQGYFVNVTAGTSTGATAIDVSSTWTKYPRYGFLTEYPVGESSSTSDARIKQTMQDYHTNAFQLYDWMWRHENMIERTGGTINSSWTNWNGKITDSWPTIQNLISSVHNYNAAAMPYTMTYAALQNYQSISGVSPTWGMYNDTLHASQAVFDFGDNDPNTNLWLFNPANTSWQNYIYGQYRDILSTAGFDGIHLDQMGQRDNMHDYNGGIVDLEHSFSGFINNLRSNLNSTGFSNKAIAFNIVNGGVTGWAANDVTTNAQTSFDYSEIWENSPNYIDLKNFINKARSNDGGKAMVLAAYMNYQENLGTRYEAESASLNGVTVNNNHTGYTGTGFVDNFGTTGNYVQFNINAPETGKYALAFQYANATGATGTRSIYVDGVLDKQISFQNQANWDTWSFDAYDVVQLTAGNHTVKIQMNATDAGFINLDSLTLGTFNEPSVRLANAAIAASGSFHIEMGEGDQMLGHPYFPNEGKQMRTSLREGMKDHYNFITAYENLLFDPDVIDNDAGTQFVSITGQTLSGNAAANTIWQQIKRNGSYDIVHLINLKNNDTTWRNTANTPVTMNNLITKVYVGNDESISSVNLASPDISNGSSQQLAFTTGTDSNGKYISFTLPSLQYWDMIYLSRTFTTPTNNVYEAETAIKTSVTTNTNHTGYTGTGFVDGFVAANEGVSFIVNAATNDDYSLRFHYSNGGTDATRDVFVDGAYAGTVRFKGTANWDTWNDGELTAHLKPGIHSIVLWYSASNTGAINLDRLNLDKTYIWQFDRAIISVPAGYRITFRTGEQGWIHSGINNWQNVTDTMMLNNGSSDTLHNYENSIGPFTSGTTVNFTFLWDDNNNGILETNIDRWQGTNYSISIP